MKTITNIEDNFRKSFLGFDSIFDSFHTLASASKYPPYNVIKVNDTTSVVEVAVAGFSKDEINISKTLNHILIEGSKETKSNSYIYKGISDKSFSLEFKIAPQLKVVESSIKDGLLTLFLVNEIQKEEKILIPISEG